MVVRNLLRRKGRTALTVAGIAIGVAAIVALGGAAQGLRIGFNALTKGSQADLVLVQAGALHPLLSSVEETIAEELSAWREMEDVDGVLFTNTLLEGSSYLFLFGYDPEGFAIEHFRVVEGESLVTARGVRGKPLLLGRRAAERLGRGVGDTLRISGTVFRVVGIYETGDAFEDGAAVVPLEEAQALALLPHRFSMIYLRLRSPAEADAVRARVERRFPDLSVMTTSEFAEQQQLLEIVEGLAIAVSGLAVLIGGVVMTNTLFMSVFERTREIGLLRALGWSRWRVLALILGESLTLSLLGGLGGVALGVLSAVLIGRSASWIGAFGTYLTPEIFVRALVTVGTLGLVGGAYPAWWASRLMPQEALRYEGGARDRLGRPLPGGMLLRNLWRRRTRTALTLLGIGISIAAVVALGGLAEGMRYLVTEMWRSSQTDLVAVEAGVDNDLSAIDERVGAQIEALPEVEAVSGIILTAANTEQMPMLIVSGYHPREFAIRHFRIVEGQPLSGPRQVIVGRRAAEQMGLQVGDTLRILRSRLRVVGIYETGLPYEDVGVVIPLREAQALTGKPHQVMFYAIKLHDPSQAEAVRDRLKAMFPEIDFSLTSEAAESMSDFRALEEMVGQISFLAVFIGTLGMLNTLLMSVLERTREIGVLRAVGWRRRRVLGMILRESLLLGVVGGSLGILLGFGLSQLIGSAPGAWGAVHPAYPPQLFAQALVVATVAGALGGIYPAWRAARLQPVEALRYE